MASEEVGQFRRKYPRRVFERHVGVLCAGQYSLMQSGEIGEGGMSLITDESLPQNQPLVISLQIPGGDFVSLRAIVKSIKNEKGRVHHGLSFQNVAFTHKRQIRSFVSARSELDEIT